MKVHELEINLLLLSLTLSECPASYPDISSLDWKFEQTIRASGMQSSHVWPMQPEDELNPGVADGIQCPDSKSYLQLGTTSSIYQQVSVNGQSEETNTGVSVNDSDYVLRDRQCSIDSDKPVETTSTSHRQLNSKSHTLQSNDAITPRVIDSECLQSCLNDNYNDDTVRNGLSNDVDDSICDNQAQELVGNLCKEHHDSDNNSCISQPADSSIDDEIVIVQKTLTGDSTQSYMAALANNVSHHEALIVENASANEICSKQSTADRVMGKHDDNSILRISQVAGNDNNSHLLRSKSTVEDGQQNFHSAENSYLHRKKSSKSLNVSKKIFSDRKVGVANNSNSRQVLNNNNGVHEVSAVKTKQKDAKHKDIELNAVECDIGLKGKKTNVMHDPKQHPGKASMLISDTSVCASSSIDHVMNTEVLADREKAKELKEKEKKLKAWEKALKGRESSLMHDTKQQAASRAYLIELENKIKTLKDSERCRNNNIQPNRQDSILRDMPHSINTNVSSSPEVHACLMSKNSCDASQQINNLTNRIQMLEMETLKNRIANLERSNMNQCMSMKPNYLQPNAVMPATQHGITNHMMTPMNFGFLPPSPYMFNIPFGAAPVNSYPWNVVNTLPQRPPGFQHYPIFPAGPAGFWKPPNTSTVYTPPQELFGNLKNSGSRMPPSNNVPPSHHPQSSLREPDGIRVYPSSNASNKRRSRRSRSSQHNGSKDFPARRHVDTVRQKAKINSQELVVTPDDPDRRRLEGNLDQQPKNLDDCDDMVQSVGDSDCVPKVPDILPSPDLDVTQAIADRNKDINILKTPQSNLVIDGGIPQYDGSCRKQLGNPFMDERNVKQTLMELRYGSSIHGKFADKISVTKDMPTMSKKPNVTFANDDKMCASDDDDLDDIVPRAEGVDDGACMKISGLDNITPSYCPESSPADMDGNLHSCSTIGHLGRSSLSQQPCSNYDLDESQADAERQEAANSSQAFQSTRVLQEGSYQPDDENDKHLENCMDKRNDKQPLMELRHGSTIHDKFVDKTSMTKDMPIMKGKQYVRILNDDNLSTTSDEDLDDIVQRAEGVDQSTCMKIYGNKVSGLDNITPSYCPESSPADIDGSLHSCCTIGCLGRSSLSQQPCSNYGLDESQAEAERQEAANSSQAFQSTRVLQEGSYQPDDEKDKHLEKYVDKKNDKQPLMDLRRGSTINDKFVDKTSMTKGMPIMNGKQYVRILNDDNLSTSSDDDLDDIVQRAEGEDHGACMKISGNKVSGLNNITPSYCPESSPADMDDSLHSCSTIGRLGRSSLTQQHCSNCGLDESQVVAERQNTYLDENTNGTDHSPSEQQKQSIEEHQSFLEKASLNLELWEWERTGARPKTR